MDKTTLDSPKRWPQAGFNKMPVVQAKHESFKINDLQSAEPNRKNSF
ncbi:hypothetical protein [Massilia sp. S19_KUP03_FR1]